MQSDIDAQLTSFFEEAPPREFVTVMRGYDRHQVDEHIRQIEAEVRSTASKPRPCSGSCRSPPPDPGAGTTHLFRPRRQH